MGAPHARQGIHVAGAERTGEDEGHHPVRGS
jgi:hypothetical protein